MSDRLTMRQASNQTGLQPQSIRQAIRRGVLLGWQEQTPRGPVWYTTQADLDAYLEQRPEHFKRLEREGQS